MQNIESENYQNLQKIIINDVEYFIIDSIQNLRAEDSFIHPKNKLDFYTGSGESRKYIGSYSGENGKILSAFFEYSDWGDLVKNGNRTYPVFQNGSCFFSKQNLVKYLSDAKYEYQQQEQVYKNDISSFYSSRLEKISSLKDEKIYFSLTDVSDLKDSNSNRAYIRSLDNIWSIWRKIVLPKISYLSILKIVPVNPKNNDLTSKFYFRVFLDYKFRSIVHPKLTDHLIETEPSKILKKATSSIRDGSQLYRRKVLEFMPQCPFTKISDDRLLIASHIKPYQVCINEKKYEEAIDYLNGLSLSPTYDKLFDQGYITFSNNGNLICGTQLSQYTWQRLSINPNAKNDMRILPEKRIKYLEYHRNFVFQDNIDEIV